MSGGFGGPHSIVASCRIRQAHAIDGPGNRLSRCSFYGGCKAGKSDNHQEEHTRHSSHNALSNAMLKFMPRRYDRLEKQSSLHIEIDQQVTSSANGALRLRTEVSRAWPLRPLLPGKPTFSRPCQLFQPRGPLYPRHQTLRGRPRLVRD